MEHCVWQERKPLLSICVPTYNRRELLGRLLETIPPDPTIEVVIVDDGSTDDTTVAVKVHEQRLNIRYSFQSNMGRAFALHEAINRASGSFTIIMDSDDYFTADGVQHIMATLLKVTGYSAFVFGVAAVRGDHRWNNTPPANVANYISIRADHRVKGDLKEVVRTSVLKRHNIAPKVGCRRIPTYLLWASIAEEYDCVTSQETVACKEYLPGGMTAQISLLKRRYPEPMLELYSILARSKRYKSFLYRIRSLILYYKYQIQMGDRRIHNVGQLGPYCVARMMYILENYRYGRVQ